MGMINFECCRCGASAEYMNKMNYLYYCEKCAPRWLKCKETMIHG
jgi:hypothetical protein